MGKKIDEDEFWDNLFDGDYDDIDGYDLDEVIDNDVDWD